MTEDISIPPKISSEIGRSRNGTEYVGVAHCTDNGVMEGFWGILKREMYYGKKFESREELEKAITEYIDYYTNDWPQRGLGVLTPMEFHEKQRLAA